MQLNYRIHFNTVGLRKSLTKSLQTVIYLRAKVVLQLLAAVL